MAAPPSPSRCASPPCTCPVFLPAPAAPATWWASTPPAFYSPSGASAGIGFAIPVNTVKEVVPQLISYGRILRPIIGVELASDAWLRRYRIEGVPVVHVYPGLPAADAGMTGAHRGPRGEIVLGDIITHVDDNRVRNNGDFLDAMEKLDPGDTVTIATRRGEESKTFEIRVIESE